MIYSNHMTSPQPGRSFPLGSSHLNGAVNFSVYSRSATAMELLLFDDAEAERPDRVITLDPTINRSFHYWHVAIPGIGDGQIYAWRADGPFDPAHGTASIPTKGSWIPTAARWWRRRDSAAPPPRARATPPPPP